MGNYGKSRILFILKMKDGKAYIKGLGQLDDQINNKFWFIPVRKSDQDAGWKKWTFIDYLITISFYKSNSLRNKLFENRSKVLCK